jgi:thiol-disulfide isomerase/thioredoxin
MKKYLLFSILTLITTIAFAQKDRDTIPKYLKSPFIPAFKIVQTNGTNFTKDSLPAEKPLIIMYFSPDCGHCQIQTKDMLDSMQYLQSATIMLVAYKKMEELIEFSNHYELSKFSNIHIGRDPKYFLPSFFNVKFTPFIAIYNKKGEFVKAFEQGASVIQMNNYL